MRGEEDKWCYKVVNNKKGSLVKHGGVPGGEVMRLQGASTESLGMKGVTHFRNRASLRCRDDEHVFLQSSCDALGTLSQKLTL